MAKVSKFLIYGLIDPRDGAIHYIGKSKSALRRPRAHGGYLLEIDPTPKGDWVRALRDAGGKYSIEVLEEFDGPEDLDSAECFWIAQARGLEWPLVNVVKGGKGCWGMKLSAESRARIGAAQLGRKPTDEHRQKNREGLLRHHREHPRSEEWCRKLSEAHKGKAPVAAFMPRTPEIRANMSAAQKLRRQKEREEREAKARESKGETSWPCA